MFYTPLERAVDRRNAMVAAVARMREMAVHLISVQHDCPRKALTEMQMWAARIDQTGEDAIEASSTQPGAFADATRDAQRRLAAEYDRRFQA